MAFLQSRGVLPCKARLWLCRTSLCALACSAPLLKAHTQQTGSPPAAAPAKASLPPPTQRQRADAENAYLSGARHLTERNYPKAEHDFATAVALNPGRTEYLAALTIAREHQITDLLQQSAQARATNPDAAKALLAQATAVDSTNPRVIEHQALASASDTEVRHATNLAGPIKLLPKPGVRSYHQRMDTRALANQIAADFGMKAAFDPDMPSRQVRIDVDDVSFPDAMRIFGMLADAMYVALEPTTVLIAADTAENHTRYDRLLEETFYIPGYSADQMKDFVSIAQTVLSIKQVSVQPGLHTLVVRGAPDEVQAAERIFDDLLQSSGDVVLNVKVYTVNTQRTRNLGVTLPSSISGYSVASQAQNILSQNSTLVQQLISSGTIPSSASTLEIAAYLVFSGLVSNNLLSNSFLIFGGGLTTGAITAGSSSTLNLALSRSDSRTLDDVQLRGSDRQDITFKLGQRYPIQTSLFSDIATPAGAASGVTVNGVSLSSLLASYLGTSNLSNSAVIPQIQYEDLGLTITAQPKIQRTSEVAMHLDVKISALAGSSLNGIPILASRQFVGDLTMKDGDTCLMISNTSQSEIAAVTGEPGLSEIPGFQSTTNKDISKTAEDLVVLITPHIVRHGHLKSLGPYVPLETRPVE